MARRERTWPLTQIGTYTCTLTLACPSLLSSFSVTCILTLVNLVMNVERLSLVRMYLRSRVPGEKSSVIRLKSFVLKRILEVQLGVVFPLLRFSRGCLESTVEPLMRQPGQPSSGANLAGGGLLKGQARASSWPEPRPSGGPAGVGVVLSFIQGGPSLPPTIPGPWILLRQHAGHNRRVRYSGLERSLISGWPPS